MIPEENIQKIFTVAVIKSFLLGWGMVLIFVVFNSLGSFTLKTQVQKLGNWNFSTAQSVISYFFTLRSSWQTWAGLVSISIATGAWIIALAHLELSKAYPVAIGFNLIIVIGISFMYFHEPLTFSKILGTFFLFTGIVFLFR